MFSNKRYNKVNNPYLTASILSKVFFLWTWPIFKTGLNQTITEKDISTNNPTLESKKLTDNFNRLWSKELKSASPSIFRIVFKYCGCSVIVKSLIYTVLELFCYAGRPICLGLLVEYFSASSKIKESQAYWYGAGLVGSVFFPLIGFHQLTFHLRLASERTRIGLSGLIYKKIMQISKATSSDGLNAKAINILSTDMSKFELAFIFVYRLWRGPLETLVFGFLMYREIGSPALIGLLLLVSFIPFQIWAGKKAVYFRRLTAERTDYRVKLMNEIIQGIQVIKMYAWEKPFSKLVSQIRKKEIKGYKGRAFVMAAVKSSSILSKISIFLSILGYIYMENELTARKVFMISSFFNILSDSMTHQFPLAITLCGEVYVSFARIGEFLMEGDHRQKVKIYDSEVKQSLFENKYKNDDYVCEKRIYKNEKFKEIKIENLLASWNDNFSLEVETLHITSSSFLGIVGPVGSGKSTLLSVILGEVPVKSGKVYISGKLSYASQEPWIFEGTIKENILFIEAYDEERYNKVLKVCGLLKDLEMFPNKDETLVGERGITLSGGQKARVNLARAVYRKADIYLFDDPLSAVDAHVGRWIFDNCLMKFLDGKIRILSTHQLQYAKSLNQIIALNFGKVVQEGLGPIILKDIASQDCKFTEEWHENKTLLAQETTNEKSSKKEHQQEGKVDWKCYLYYFQCLGNPFLILIIILLFISSRVLLTGVDFFLSRW